MLSKVIYTASVLNNASDVFAVLTMIAAMCLIGVAAFLFLATADPKDWDIMGPRLLLLGALALIGTLVFGTAYVFVPNGKTYAAMQVAKALERNENTAQLPDKLITLTNEWLESLRPEQKQ